MIIHARTAPIELILYVHVWDSSGTLVDRVVYLDTDRMVARQYVRNTDESSFEEIEVSRFEFRANHQLTEQMLRELLPEELQDKIVSAKT
jgi:hypothetical protein